MSLEQGGQPWFFCPAWAQQSAYAILLKHCLIFSKILPPLCLLFSFPLIFLSQIRTLLVSVLSFFMQMKTCGYMCICTEALGLFPPFPSPPLTPRLPDPLTPGHGDVYRLILARYSMVWVSQVLLSHFSTCGTKQLTRPSCVGLSISLPRSVRPSFLPFSLSLFVRFIHI